MPSPPAPSDLPGSVAAGIARAVLDHAAARGADRAALLAAAALSEAALDDPDGRVSMTAFFRLTGAAARETADPAFLLDYATGTRLDRISIVGLIVHAAPTMAEALRQLNRYARLMVEVDAGQAGPRFAVEPGPEGVWIVDLRPDPNAFPGLTEMAFGRFVGEFAREFPGRPFGKRLEVTHPAPAHAEAYARLLALPVTFSAPRNALLIDPGWLETPFEGATDYVFGLFTERAERLLADLDAAGTLAARIEAHLLPRLHTGDVSVDTVAADLGMSRQTLYRRLRDEGTSFAALHDDLRRRMALDYLSARKVSVNQTAYLVGFSEPSAFTRAFRRWTGVPPATWRAQAAG